MSPSQTTKKPGCLAAVPFSMFNPRSNKPNIAVKPLPTDKEEDSFPYRLRDDFLSPA